MFIPTETIAYAEPTNVFQPQRRFNRHADRKRILSLLCGIFFLGCGDDTTAGSGGASGSSGTAGTAGVAASGGSSGAGGTGGTGGTAGTAGTAGTGGTASAGGTAGSSGHPPADGPCYPKDPSCGTPGTSCISRFDQSALPKKLLRVSQLAIHEPAQLATQVFQDLILHPAVTLPEEQCYLVNGAATLNWLFEIDLAAQTGRTGVSTPIANLDAGYCLMSATVGAFEVAPADMALHVVDHGDGSYALSTSEAIPRLVIPLDYDAPTGTASLLLPLNNVQLSNGVVSEDGNCIGRFRGAAGELDPATSCLPDTEMSSPNYWSFIDGATLEGTIRIDEADQVIIADLNNVSLCAFLAKLPTDQKSCGPNNAKALAIAKDTNNDGVADSFPFSATFAASGSRFFTPDGSCH